MKSKIIVFLILIVINSCIASAVIEQDHVLINSKDWQDVYSSILYAKLDGKPASFLMNPSYAAILLNVINKDYNVLVISSKDRPYIKGYKAILDSNDYGGEEITLENANFEIAQMLDDDITKFIIIDDTYGYNAISAASYAVVSHSYVLFANDVNIGDIVAYLNARTIDEIIIFGQVDREVKDALSAFNPEIINAGDRFDNNLAIVDRYLGYKDTQQVTMTNGEFIEESIMSGDNPVIFIGRNNVPDSVRDYIRSSDFTVAVLIGNELVGPATSIRRQLGISVFVKFAQGARNPAGSIAQVEDLDKFPMPLYQVAISVSDIRYNIATRQLEVTYQNIRNLAAYFKSTITITGGGEEIVVGDENPIFLDGGEIKTIGYPLEFGSIPEEISADLFVLFGEAPKSLEFVYQDRRDISMINVLDDSEIDIVSVLYDKGRKRFEIEVENLKDFDTYASAEIVDLVVNGESKTYASDKVVHLGPLKKGKMYVRTNDFLDVDFEDNEFINVQVYYGQREASLIKTISGEYELILAKGRYILYALVIILVVLLLLTFILGKKCENCKANNSPIAKTCRKCGHRL